MSQFSTKVGKVLREAGWFPGRKVSDERIQQWDTIRPLFSAAREALQEFAGLYVEASGSIFVESGRINRDEYDPPFCIDPIAA